MAAAEELLIFLRANTSEFSAKMKEAEAEVHGFSTRGGGALSKFASLGGASLAVAGAGALLVGAASIKAADDFEKSHARLETALKRAGTSFEEEKGKIDDQKTSMEKLGFTYDETEGSLARFVTLTHDVKKSVDLQNIAVDLAAGRNISLTAATDALIKANNGNYTALIKAGIVSKDQAKNFKSSADAVNFLANAMKGQGQAAADTFGGKIKVLQATVEDIAVGIGLKLIPVIESLASGLSDTIHWFEENKAAAYALGGVIAAVLIPAMLTFIALKVGAAVTAISDAFSLGVTAVRVYASEFADMLPAMSGVLAGLGTMSLVLAPLAGLYAITGGAIFDFSDASDNAAKAAKGWAEAAVTSSVKMVGSTKLAQVTQKDLADDVTRLQARQKLLQNSISGGTNEWSKYGKTLLDVQHQEETVGKQIDEAKGKHIALTAAIRAAEKAAHDHAKAEADAASATGHASENAIELQAADDKLGKAAADASKELDAQAKTTQTFSDATFSAIDSQFALTDALANLHTELFKGKGASEDAQKALEAVVVAAGKNAAEQAGPTASAFEKTQKSQQAQLFTLQALKKEYPALGPVIDQWTAKLVTNIGASEQNSTANDAAIKVLDALKNKYPTLGPEIDKLEGHIRDLTGTINSSDPSVTAAVSVLDALKNKYPQLIPEIDKLEGKIRDLGGTVNSVPEHHNTDFTVSGLDAARAQLSVFLQGLVNSAFHGSALPPAPGGGLTPEQRWAWAAAGGKIPPGVAAGGSIPGPIGTPLPRILHGGEVVLNASQVQALNQGAVLYGNGTPKGSAGGGDMYIINASSLAEHQIGDTVMSALRTVKRRGGPGVFRELVN